MRCGSLMLLWKLSKYRIGVNVMLLAGQVTIITGGGRGIGRAIALGFAREGSSVLLAARTQTQVDSVAAELKSEGHKAAAVAARPGLVAWLPRPGPWLDWLKGRARIRAAWHCRMVAFGPCHGGWSLAGLDGRCGVAGAADPCSDAHRSTPGQIRGAGNRGRVICSLGCSCAGTVAARSRRIGYRCGRYCPERSLAAL